MADSLRLSFSHNSPFVDLCSSFHSNGSLMYDGAQHRQASGINIGLDITEYTLSFSYADKHGQLVEGLRVNSSGITPTPPTGQCSDFSRRNIEKSQMKFIYLATLVMYIAYSVVKVEHEIAQNLQQWVRSHGPQENPTGGAATDNPKGINATLAEMGDKQTWTAAATKALVGVVELVFVVVFWVTACGFGMLLVAIVKTSAEN